MSSSTHHALVSSHTVFCCAGIHSYCCFSMNFHSSTYLSFHEPQALRVLSQSLERSSLEPSVAAFHFLFPQQMSILVFSFPFRAYGYATYSGGNKTVFLLLSISLHPSNHPSCPFSGRSPLLGSSRSGATPRVPSAGTARERTDLGSIQESQRASQETRLEAEIPGQHTDQP